MTRGFKNEYCTLTLHQLWASGASYIEIAAAIGCSQSFIHTLKSRHKLPNRQRVTRKVCDNDPTLEEIAERAAECRARRETTAEPKAERVSIARYTFDGRRFHAIG